MWMELLFQAIRKLGWVLLSEMRKVRVIAALSKNNKAPLGPLDVEAKAFEASFQFAKDIGIHDFILECDSFINLV